VSGSFVGKREADDDPVTGERIRINATAKKEIGLSIVNGLPRLPNEKCGIESKHARHMKAEPDQPFIRVIAKIISKTKQLPSS
jgi:hypothetical protein